MRKTLPAGHFKFLLMADSETTGLHFNSSTPNIDPRTGETFQAISWGLIVVDADTLQPVEELYREIKYDGTSTWNARAEQVHGLSKEYLELHGYDEEEAVIDIAELLLKYWGPDSSISFAGWNVGTFDLPFFRSLMEKYEVPIKISNRHVDVFSLAYGTLGTFTSDEAFEAVGIIRDKHNALEDARATLTVLQAISGVWDETAAPLLAA